MVTEQPMCDVSRAQDSVPALTDVRGQLLGGVWCELRDLQDDLAVRLHRGSGDGAQPVISHVVQLGQLVSCTDNPR